MVNVLIGGNRCVPRICICNFCLLWQITDDYTNSATGNKRPLVDLLGWWHDINQLTYPAIPLADRHLYFKIYESLYQTLLVKLSDYFNVEMDVLLMNFEHLQYASTFKADVWGPYIDRMFSISDGYFWREAGEKDKLYHHFDDGSQCISVTHFKSGLRLPMHKFMVDLFRYQFRCPVTQLTPNAIKYILWFIVSCEARGKQPTYKAFFFFV